MFSLLRHWLLTADPTTHVRLSNTSDWLDLMNQINWMSPSTYSKEQGISWYSKWLCESQEDLKRVTSYSKYSLNYIIYLKNSQPIEFANLTYTLVFTNLKYWELDLNTKNFNKLKIGIVVDLPDDEVHDDFTNRVLESVIKTVNTDKN